MQYSVAVASVTTQRDVLEQLSKGVSVERGNVCVPYHMLDCEWLSNGMPWERVRNAGTHAGSLELIKAPAPESMLI